MSAVINLFTPDLADVERGIAEAMWQGAKESPMSREQIVDRMNEIAVKQGRKLTTGNAKELSLAMFDKWLNPAESHTPSFYALGVFAKVAENQGVFEAQTRPHGYRVITEHQGKMLRMKEIEIQRAKLAKEERELKREMGL